VAQAQAQAEKAHADLERIKPLAEKDIVPSRRSMRRGGGAGGGRGPAAAQAALLGADARVAAARACARPGCAQPLLHPDHRAREVW